MSSLEQYFRCNNNFRVLGGGTVRHFSFKLFFSSITILIWQDYFYQSCFYKGMKSKGWIFRCRLRIPYFLQIYQSQRSFVCLKIQCIFVQPTAITPNNVLLIRSKFQRSGWNSSSRIVARVAECRTSTPRTTPQARTKISFKEFIKLNELDESRGKERISDRRLLGLLYCPIIILGHRFQNSLQF